MKISKTKQMVVLAATKGYIVNEEGDVISPSGDLRTTRVNGGYKTFTINDGTCLRYPIPVHRLQAYQMFGTVAFGEGIVTRHLNEDSFDNSENNIDIGSHSDNMLDIAPQARREHARKAGKANGLSDSTILELKQLHVKGCSYSTIANALNIAKSTVSYYISDSAKRQAM